jgi:hypothetical protein
MTQDFGKVEVEIPCGDLTLNGTLSLPIEPHGMILFAHGSGSSRFSTRNQFVANVLNKGNFATLLLDLLHPNEDQTSAARFDIDLLTNRLWHAFIWSKNYQKNKIVTNWSFWCKHRGSRNLTICRKSTAGG